MNIVTQIPHSITPKINKYATSVRRSSESTIVKFHDTDIVFVTPNGNGGFLVKLHTGGWFTATTKLRMNQTSDQYNLGYHVYQKDFAWYVTISSGETLPFIHRWVEFTR